MGRDAGLPAFSAIRCNAVISNHVEGIGDGTEETTFSGGGSPPGGVILVSGSAISAVGIGVDCLSLSLRLKQKKN